MLHIVNKSPTDRHSLESCLRVAAPGGALLLIEDAVYAVAKGAGLETRMKEALARFPIYALLPDLEARAIADRVIDGVRAIDYGAFVDLVAEHKCCQSWL